MARFQAFGRFPKLGGTYLGVPIIRTIVYWGLYWGTLILGNYHFGVQQKVRGLRFGALGLGFQGLGLRVPAFGFKDVLFGVVCFFSSTLLPSLFYPP